MQLASKLDDVRRVRRLSTALLTTMLASVPARAQEPTTCAPRPCFGRVCPDLPAPMPACTATAELTIEIDNRSAFEVTPVLTGVLVDPAGTCSDLGAAAYSSPAAPCPAGGTCTRVIPLHAASHLLERATTAPTLRKAGRLQRRADSKLARALRAASRASSLRPPHLSADCSLAIRTMADGVRQCLARRR